MKDQPVLCAIDLGAESCRVSLLQWPQGRAEIKMVRRFGNGPVETGTELHWDLARICTELEKGLRACAELAPGGIDAIGVTGWGVDCVRLGDDGKPVGQPFCYRDPRNAAAMEELHGIVPAAELYGKTGVQIQPINTIYQLFADKRTSVPADAPFLNLPEYILHWLGGRRVAEMTNATHTALVDPVSRQWSEELIGTVGLDRRAAQELVEPGTVVGTLQGELAKLPAFAKTVLIAPCCHDTASAIAGIPAEPGSWAYISSGTWSLVGMLLPESHRTARAGALGFTNLGAAGGNVLFHRGMVGMWMLRQCMNTWDEERGWSFAELIGEAEKLPAPDQVLDLDDPAFVTPGDMPARINAQRESMGLKPLPPGCAAAPHYANLIFYSLAHRYGAILKEIEDLTGRKPDRICVVGGGNRNEMLNRLTSEATGLPVERCSVESSTLGNFALQWARLDEGKDGPSNKAITRRARDLSQVALG